MKIVHQPQQKQSLTYCRIGAFFSTLSINSFINTLGLAVPYSVPDSLMVPVVTLALVTSLFIYLSLLSVPLYLVMLVHIPAADP